MTMEVIVLVFNFDEIMPVFDYISEEVVLILLASFRKARFSFTAFYCVQDCMLDPDLSDSFPYKEKRSQYMQSSVVVVEVRDDCFQRFFDLLCQHFPFDFIEVIKSFNEVFFEVFFRDLL